MNVLGETADIEAALGGVSTLFLEAAKARASPEQIRLACLCQ